MNKPLLKILSLFAFLLVLACNAPRSLEQEPLKTVEQVRREAHRTANNDADESMPTNQEEDEDGSEDDDSGNEGDQAAVPVANPAMPTVSTTTNQADEFIEKSVGSIGEKPTYMQENEFAMVAEVNLIRADPQGYTEYVKQYIQQIEQDDRLDAAYKTEEIATAQELINELKDLSKLSILQPHAGLYTVGQQHGKDVQQQGMINHRGSDGTMPWDRVRNETNLQDGNENLVGGGESVREQVMILLVDSGIPGRGHRKTLLEPKWTHVACHKIGQVGDIPNNWIQVFGQE